jgi:hypothetical protein
MRPICAPNRSFRAAANQLTESARTKNPFRAQGCIICRPSYAVCCYAKLIDHACQPVFFAHRDCPRSERMMRDEQRCSQCVLLKSAGPLAPRQDRPPARPRADHRTIGLLKSTSSHLLPIRYGGLGVCVRTPHCVVPSGLDLPEMLPGTPVPGYRLSRPFGTDCVGDLRFFSTSLKPSSLAAFTARLKPCPDTKLERTTGTRKGSREMGRARVLADMLVHLSYKDRRATGALGRLWRTLFSPKSGYEDT